MRTLTSMAVVLAWATVAIAQTDDHRAYGLWVAPTTSEAMVEGDAGGGSHATIDFFDLPLGTQECYGHLIAPRFATPGASVAEMLTHMHAEVDELDERILLLRNSIAMLERYLNVGGTPHGDSLPETNKP